MMTEQDLVGASSGLLLRDATATSTLRPAVAEARPGHPTSGQEPDGNLQCGQATDTTLRDRRNTGAYR